MTFTYEDIPADMQTACEEWRQNLVDAAAEATEELMEKYLGGEDLSEEEIKAGLRQRVLTNEIILVLVVLHFKTKVFKRCLMQLLNTYRHQLIFQQSKVSTR